MLNIKHPDADKLARALAKQTGKSITGVIIEALQEKLIRAAGRRMPANLRNDLISIAKRCASLPDLDNRTPDTIIGYNEQGLPK